MNSFMDKHSMKQHRRRRRAVDLNLMMRLGLSITVALISPSSISKTADLNEPAKALFGSQTEAADLSPAALGYYSKGCLAGATALPINGPAWQAMRLSRQRYWGHPNTIEFVTWLATSAKQEDGWNGLLIGDISQARGGPMLTGHRSHQVGLDADIWWMPMPNERLTEQQREELSATSVIKKGTRHVDPNIWSNKHYLLLKRAASHKEVERILVHPGIKKAMCDMAGPINQENTQWLGKIRPYWGHNYHFHVRLRCPTDGSSLCKKQPAVKPGAGCGKQLDWWFTEEPWAKPPPPKKPFKPRPPMTLKELPAACIDVLEAPATNSATTQ